MSGVHFLYLTGIQMSDENVLAHLAGASPDERLQIEVRISADSHLPVLSIRHQAWGNGIGWFTQASVDVPAASIAELKRALCLVPGAIQRTNFLLSGKKLSESEETPSVIPFPGLRTLGEHNKNNEE